jgi:nitroimidazol reductase NimA-like FMN-containing flavoprotein (pyridoxamine 5'-phosphate oxidase superfamily)
MSFADERTGLEVLGLAECVENLESHEIARVAFLADGMVHLYPVNYVWDGEAIVFRCESNTPMARATGREFVVEIDELDLRERQGWSVIARGIANRVDPKEVPEMAARLERLALYPWAAGAKDVWLRMIPAPLTGRRAARKTE